MISRVRWMIRQAVAFSLLVAGCYLISYAAVAYVVWEWPLAEYSILAMIRIASLVSAGAIVYAHLRDY
jgi:hypothetical protein